MNTAASSHLRRGQLFWAFHRTPCGQPPVQAHAHLARRLWRACCTTVAFQLRLDNPALLWPSPHRGGPGTPAFRSRTRTKASPMPRRRRHGPGMPDPVRTRLATVRPTAQQASPYSATLPDPVHAPALHCRHRRGHTMRASRALALEPRPLPFLAAKSSTLPCTFPSTT